jgi:FlaA1/EpsC-like NDP-sugar epimerase
MYARLISMNKTGLLAGERVLIVGAGDTGQFAAWRLKHTNESSSYQIVGFVDDDMYRQGSRLNGVTVLGKRADIAALVEKHDIGVIIFAIHNISSIERASLLKSCRSTNARVITWPDTVSLIRAQPLHTKASAPVKTGPLQHESASLMLHWLDVLETNLDVGDFARVMEDIYIMRSSLQKKIQNNKAEL